MKRIVRLTVCALFLFAVPIRALAAELLVPVGQVIALQLKSQAVTVAAFDEAAGAAARDAGLRIGDQIVAINGQSITDAEQIPQLLKDGTTAAVTVIRGSRQKVLTLPLYVSGEGNRLGVYLRQGIAGIGTVTWYDPDTGAFGALGHGVSDGAGSLLVMTQGSIFDASVESVRRGRCGDPGQLKGSAQEGQPRGSLTCNTPQGVFGRTAYPWQGQAIPAADFEEITMGNAQILSTIDSSGPREYSVEIVKIYPEERPDGRNFLLRVTDPNLLNTTGGIVQGMSGSPIIQNGKLVGAVTHVLVNDPTTGYGIFIENMLDAAS